MGFSLHVFVICHRSVRVNLHVPYLKKKGNVINQMPKLKQEQYQVGQIDFLELVAVCFSSTDFSRVSEIHSNYIKISKLT